MAAPASREEIERVQLELIRIAGLTPLKKPWLMLRWGGTYTEWIDGRQMLKYWLCNTADVCTGYYYRDESGEIVKVPHGKLAEVPIKKIALPLYEHTELGERRWIIEQWRSPEFMHKSGRAEATHDNLPELLCCHVCDTPKAERGKKCHECGSLREYETKGDGHRLLADDFSEGHYDFFMRLEGRQIGCEACDQGVCPDATHTTYRAPNALMLTAVANQWNYQQNRTDTQKTADNAAMDVRVSVCSFCLKEVEHMKKCPHCGGTHQTDMTPKTLAAQRRIWSEQNIATHKGRIEQESKRGASISVL